MKVPLGINRKNGSRSQFLDPNTFEPCTGEVPIPGYVRLRELPEYAPRAKVQIKEDVTEDRGLKCSPINSTCSDLRHCMKNLLADKVSLNGGEGNDMRVAIAAEAYNIGLPIESTIDLFKDQPDFNRDISRRDVTYVYSRGYGRYSCQTLWDKCGSLVSPYCPTCPLSG